MYRQLIGFNSKPHSIFLKGMKCINILLLVFPLWTQSQTSKTIHPTILGARFNLLDFASAKPFGKISNTTSGLGFNFVKGINSHFDWSISLDGAFSDSMTDMKLSDKKLLLQAEFGVRGRMFTTGSRFQPFLALGIGISTYNNYVSSFIPAGMGLQVGLFKDAYLIVHAQYRISIPQSINNHYFYSIGFSGAISNSKRKSNKDTRPATTAVPSQVFLDSDQDGIVDTADACPDKPGMAQFAGCPDKDEDGIPDKNDNCPGVFGTLKYQGCPIPDSDMDGINDEQDSCISVFGIIQFKGCPAPDSDNDGVTDLDDRCPDIAGPATSNGCPEIKKEIETSVNKAAKNILFATGSYQLLSVSNKSLNEVVKILKEDTLIKVNIEGHTDNVGQSIKNQELSEQRAKAVMKYLIKNDISGNRLQSSGYGESKPISTNNSTKSRTLNRRVEMKLTY